MNYTEYNDVVQCDLFLDNLQKDVYQSFIYTKYNNVSFCVGFLYALHICKFMLLYHLRMYCHLAHCVLQCIHDMRNIPKKCTYKK